jgi:UMF1 family MFS transporter
MLAWCLFDWANSGFPTVVTTFVFAAFYAKAVAADDVAGTSQWAFAMSASALAVALTSPLLGAIADRAGGRKPWVFVFTVICVVATALLWLVRPDPAWALAALVFAGLANYAFESGIVFYNAMLPSLAPPHMIGRLSGWGWGVGYFGGLACLGVALVVLIRPDPPWFGLDKEAAEPVRATALLVAAWFAVFSIPFFLFTPDEPRRGLSLGEAVRQGVATLAGTLGHVRRYRTVALYLLAHMIYADGLTTLFAVGGIYAAVTFDMGVEQLLLFGIAMNVTAGIGAFAFGWIDDWLGAKPTIFIALTGMTALGIALLVVTTQAWFWVFALPLGLFFGPAQSASRSLMARLAPPNLQTEMFGLYALSGKATAFLGPAVFGTVTALFDSQRAGLATIPVFIVVGMLLLIPVSVAAADADHERTSAAAP